MGTIIPLHGDPHGMTQELLPWYVNGTLDPGERQLVDDHLEQCADCRHDLASERRMALVLTGLSGDEPVPKPEMPVTPPLASPATLRRQSPWYSGVGARLALIAASQIAIIGVALTLYSSGFGPRGDDYHLLSSKAAAPAGNAIVIFRPDIAEADLRIALLSVNARIVDGPTAADAYVLHIDPATLGTALASLRGTKDVVLAQPIGQTTTP